MKNTAFIVSKEEIARQNAEVVDAATTFIKAIRCFYGEERDDLLERFLSVYGQIATGMGMEWAGDKANFQVFQAMFKEWDAMVYATDRTH